jgi:hypothetical protein
VQESFYSPGREERTSQQDMHRFTPPVQSHTRVAFLLFPLPWKITGRFFSLLPQLFSATSHFNQKQ